MVPINPADVRLCPSESHEQRALAQWLSAKRLLWCAVPNGGKRNLLVALKLKAEGVQPGVPDILIFSRPPRRPGARGVACELKRQKGGRLTPSQVEWLGALQAEGWEANCCPGAAAAVDWLTHDMGF